ncbi:MAG: hypothetical protein NXI31_26910 [bacterium]|nr:hypothetical protein [bacterium]
MQSDATPEGIIIPDFSNWIVGDAFQKCADLGVGLSIENKPDGATDRKVNEGTIKQNGRA